MFVPLFALSGIEGRLFAPLGEAYIVSILASLVVSITLTPVMAYYLLPRHEAPGTTRDSRLVRGSEARQSALARLGLRAAAPVVMAAASCGRDRRVRRGRCCRARSCRPSTKARSPSTSLLNPGISLAESNRVGLHRRAADPGGAGGEGRRAAAPGAPNSTSMPKAFTPPRSTSTSSRRARPKTEIVADIRSRLAVLPVAVNVGQPISHRLDHMLSGVRAQIAAQNLRRRPRHAARPSAEDLRSGSQPFRASSTCRSRSRFAFPQLEISRRLHEGRALWRRSRWRVTEPETLLNGRVVSRVVDGYRRFDVTLRLPNPMRTTEGLGDLLIETPAGWIPARQIADSARPTAPTRSCARTLAGASSFSRTPMARPTWRRSSPTIRSDLRRAHLPEGYFTRLEGTFQAQEEASRDHRCSVRSCRSR